MIKIRYTVNVKLSKYLDLIILSVRDFYALFNSLIISYHEFSLLSSVVLKFVDICIDAQIERMIFMYKAQIVKERIKFLCKRKKVDMEDMLSELSLGINAIRQINDTKGMGSFSLAKIADYLEVSVDYLLGRTDNPYVSGSYINGDNSVQAIQNSSVTINQGQKETDQENHELLNLIQSLPLKKRAKIITMIYDALEEEL